MEVALSAEMALQLNDREPPPSDLPCVAKRREVRE